MNGQPHLAELRPQDLPRPPEAALRILSACADPDAELAAIARLVARDPGLAADLLRVINSPYFGFDKKIASIDLAVSLLGLNALRNRVLCVALRTAAAEADLANIDLDAFLEDSVRRAVAARELATHANIDPDDAFVAGLLQDFGLLALFFVDPGVPHARWVEMRRSLPAARLVLETDAFGARHDTVLGELATSWCLPEDLALAVVSHHGDGERPQLSRILHAADWLNAVFTSDEPAAALRQVEALLAADPGLAGVQGRALMSAIPELVEQAASSLGVRVSSRVDVDALTRDINLRLADDNLSYQELNWELQQTIRERDELAAEREREMEIAREIQCSLLPQGDGCSCPVWALNVSARVLSGDFYDYFPQHDGCICFSLGDVSGKGLTAALLMAKTSSLFRCLGRRSAGLVEVMSVLNDELCETAVRGMFVTMVAGRFDPRTLELELVNAGHPPPLLRQGDGSFTAVEGSSLPLGIIPGSAFSGRMLSMRGASLYLYSDGITEALDQDGHALGPDGLAGLIRAFVTMPPKARIAAIFERLVAGGSSLHDDLTLAVLDPGATSGPTASSARRPE